MTRSLIEELQGREVIVCCGSGGVGKTTTSAVLGMALAARQEMRVLVLTIDPAKRLATALGVPQLGSEPAHVSSARLRRAGIDPAGELWAAMLDPKSAWDEVVDRYAPDHDTARAIKSNRFYRSISEAFAGSQEYIAMEALYELHRSEEYDCIVVDTPPSRNALDFLEAPSRVSDFVGKRFIGWLAGGTRFGFRAFDLAAMPLTRIADKILGTDALDELREFAGLISELYDGLQKRGRDVYRLLRSERCGFVVITTLDPEAFAEAEFFASKLRQFTMPLRGMVVNRVLPEWLQDRAAAKAATQLAEDEQLHRWLVRHCDLHANAEQLRRLGETFLTQHRLAVRDAAQLNRLTKLGKVPVVKVPLFDQGIADLEGLVKIAELL